MILSISLINITDAVRLCLLGLVAQTIRDLPPTAPVAFATGAFLHEGASTASFGTATNEGQAFSRQSPSLAAQMDS